MIILDTNVLSEPIKPLPCGPVVDWLAAQEFAEVFTTSITQAEILRGIELLPAGKRRMKLHEAADQMFAEEFHGRILPFDDEAARVYAKISAARSAAGRPIPQSDAMIASIARTRHATVATRNTRDFGGCDIQLVNPWTE